MTALKTILATAAAMTLAGAALAQSTPPNPAAKDPAMGAGQRSTQNTPMGATGTPAGGSTMSSSGSSTGGSTSGSTASSSGTGSTSGTSMGASGSTDTSASASGSGSMTKSKRGHKRARADRG